MGDVCAEFQTEEGEMKLNAILAVVIALALGGIAVGCGDDNNDSGDEALTKQEFLAKGNAICAAGNKEIETAFQTAIGNAKPTQDQLNTVVTDSLVPSIQGQIDDIRDLPAPDEDQIGPILDEAELALQDVKENPSLATQGGGQDPFADVNKKLTEYGLTACGSSE
jgi:hypothetical protein